MKIQISQKAKTALDLAVGQIADKIRDEQTKAYARAIADFEMRQVKRMAVYDPMKPVPGAKYARFVELGAAKYACENWDS